MKRGGEQKKEVMASGSIALGKKKSQAQNGFQRACKEDLRKSLDRMSARRGTNQNTRLRKKEEAETPDRPKKQRRWPISTREVVDKKKGRVPAEFEPEVTPKTEKTANHTIKKVFKGKKSTKVDLVPLQ